MSAAPLSFDDAFEILRPAFPDDSLVLVGGQAVNYWLTYYRGRVESLADLAGVTSDDVDFFGTVQAAARVAQAIHGTLRRGTLDDHGPNAATVTFQDSRGDSRVIDFLSAVHGLSDDAKIRDTALPVEILDVLGHRTGIELRVLHPVLCLCSRTHNTHTFAKYQTDRAIRQLRAAIGCARGYILEQCDAGQTRSAHRAINVVGELACSNVGRDVYSRFGADPLDAIPEDARLGEKFVRIRLPQLRAQAGRDLSP